MKSQYCPCLSGQTYQDCCGLLHQGKQTAVTAEQLMRSRYSAFVMQHSNYLQTTLHPSLRHPDDIVNLQQTMQTTQWLGLTIVEHSQDGDYMKDHGFVDRMAYGFIWMVSSCHPSNLAEMITAFVAVEKNSNAATGDVSYFFHLNNVCV